MRVIVVASLEYSSVKSKAVATTNEKKINTNEHIEIDEKKNSGDLFRKSNWFWNGKLALASNKVG